MTGRPTAMLRVASMIAEGATFRQATDWVLRRMAPSLQTHYRAEIFVDLRQAGLV